jgi:raffinose/stachyose/melibiose transport system permease protein
VSRYTKWTAFRELGFWILGLGVILPIYFLITLSLKSSAGAAETGVAPPWNPTFENYSHAWSEGGAGAATFSQAMLNSVITTVAVVAILIIVGAPAGYAIARRRSRLSGTAFWLFAAGLILPVQLATIPLFSIMVETGLEGTRLGLILAYVGFMLPMTVFLYTGFFQSLPLDYEEAAQIDGASPSRTFVQVVLPLVKPVTGTVAILAGLFVWKDFYGPLVFVGGTDNVTLPVAIYSFVGKYVTAWNLIFASIVIALAPIVVVYIAMQRYIIKGFVSTVRG